VERWPEPLGLKLSIVAPIRRMGDEKGLARAATGWFVVLIAVECLTASAN
jgi:hypothetical protein